MTYADTFAQVEALVRERPDLVPLLRRIVEAGGQGHFDTEDPSALRELVRRGLLAADAPGARQP